MRGNLDAITGLFKAHASGKILVVTGGHQPGQWDSHLSRARSWSHLEEGRHGAGHIPLLQTRSRGFVAMAPLLPAARPLAPRTTRSRPPKTPPATPWRRAWRFKSITDLVSSIPLQVSRGNTPAPS
jgi:hypothetical protein